MNPKKAYSLIPELAEKEGIPAAEYEQMVKTFWLTLRDRMEDFGKATYPYYIDIPGLGRMRIAVGKVRKDYMKLDKLLDTKKAQYTPYIQERKRWLLFRRFIADHNKNLAVKIEQNLALKQAKRANNDTQGETTEGMGQ